MIGVDRSDWSAFKRTHPGFAGVHVLADDDSRWNHDPVEQARFACRGGAQVVQLRAKHATDRVTLEWARAIREITLETETAFVCLLYTSPSPRDKRQSRMPSSA